MAFSRRAANRKEFSTLATSPNVDNNDEPSYEGAPVDHHNIVTEHHV